MWSDKIGMRCLFLCAVVFLLLAGVAAPLRAQEDERTWKMGPNTQKAVLETLKKREPARPDAGRHGLGNGAGQNVRGNQGAGGVAGK